MQLGKEAEESREYTQTTRQEKAVDNSNRTPPLKIKYWN